MWNGGMRTTTYNITSSSYYKCAADRISHSYTHTHTRIKKAIANSSICSCPDLFSIGFEGTCTPPQSNKNKKKSEAPLCSLSPVSSNMLWLADAVRGIDINGKLTYKHIVLLGCSLCFRYFFSSFSLLLVTMIWHSTAYHAYWMFDENDCMIQPFVSWIEYWAELWHRQQWWQIVSWCCYCCCAVHFGSVYLATSYSYISCLFVFNKHNDVYFNVIWFYWKRMCNSASLRERERSRESWHGHEKWRWSILSTYCYLHFETHISYSRQRHERLLKTTSSIRKTIALIMK